VQDYEGVREWTTDRGDKPTDRPSVQPVAHINKCAQAHSWLPYAHPCGIVAWWHLAEFCGAH